MEGCNFQVFVDAASSLIRRDYTVNCDYLLDVAGISANEVLLRANHANLTEEHTREGCPSAKPFNLTSDERFVDNVIAASHMVLDRFNNYLQNTFFQCDTETAEVEDYLVLLLRCLRDQVDYIPKNVVDKIGIESDLMRRQCSLEVDNLAEKAWSKVRNAFFKNYNDLLKILFGGSQYYISEDGFGAFLETTLADTNNEYRRTACTWMMESIERACKTYSHPKLPLRDHKRIIEASRVGHEVLDGVIVRPIGRAMLEDAEIILDIDFQSLVERRSIEARRKSDIVDDEIGNDKMNILLEIDEHGIYRILNVEKWNVH